MGLLYSWLDPLGWIYHHSHTWHKHIFGPYWMLRGIFLFGMCIYLPHYFTASKTSLLASFMGSWVSPYLVIPPSRMPCFVDLVFFLVWYMWTLVVASKFGRHLMMLVVVETYHPPKYPCCISSIYLIDDLLTDAACRYAIKSHILVNCQFVLHCDIGLYSHLLYGLVHILMGSSTELFACLYFQWVRFDSIFDAYINLTKFGLSSHITHLYNWY